MICNATPNTVNTVLIKASAISVRARCSSTGSRISDLDADISKIIINQGSRFQRDAGCQPPGMAP